jgi:hypothetical protein
MTPTPSAPNPGIGGHVVRGPQPGDAVGKALRGAFGGSALPTVDMQAALDELDRLACAAH